jgi:hypothetical protein
MLSLKNKDGSHVVVLDNVDLLRLRETPLATLDGHLLIACSPDLAWVAAAFREAESNGGLSTQKIVSILATARVKDEK